MYRASDHNSVDDPLLRSPQEEAGGWDRRLAALQEGLGVLQHVQRRWLYLGPIFARGALPAQQQRFRHVDAQVRSAPLGFLPMCGAHLCPAQPRPFTLACEGALRASLVVGRNKSFDSPSTSLVAPGKCKWHGLDRVL